MKNATEDIVMMGGSNNFSQIDDYLMDLTELTKIKAYDEDGEYVGKGNGVKTLEDKMKAYENNYKMFNVGTPRTAEIQVASVVQLDLRALVRYRPFRGRKPVQSAGIQGHRRNCGY